MIFRFFILTKILLSAFFTHSAISATKEGVFGNENQANYTGVQIILAVITTQEFEDITGSDVFALRMDPEERMTQAERIFALIDKGGLQTWGAHKVEVDESLKILYQPEDRLTTDAFVLKGLEGTIEAKSSGSSGFGVWCDVHCSYHDRIDGVGRSGPIYPGKQFGLSEQFPAEMLDISTREHYHLIFLARLLTADQLAQAIP